jgi:hypothetical protein
MRFKPLRWADMPLSARKCYMRLCRSFPGVDGRFRGWETFHTWAEPNKMYAVSRDMRWFVAKTDSAAAGA